MSNVNRHGVWAESPMNTTNSAIMELTKYESPGAALTARGMTQEGLVPMSDNDTPTSNLIPFGYCQCGCGERTSVAKCTDSRYGHIKGEPTAFVNGHNNYRTRTAPRWRDDLSCFSVHLGADKFCLVDEIDLPIASRFPWTAAANGGNVYVKRTEYTPTGKKISRYLHREVLNPSAGYVVDHINGDGLDNRRSNLRICSPTDNKRNITRPRSNNSTGYSGVYKYRRDGFWVAKIRNSSRLVQLGLFQCPIEAAIFRDVAALDLHGEFASLNFPELRDLLVDAKRDRLLAAAKEAGKP